MKLGATVLVFAATGQAQLGLPGFMRAAGRRRGRQARAHLTVVTDAGLASASADSVRRTEFARAV